MSPTIVFLVVALMASRSASRSPALPERERASKATSNSAWMKPMGFIHALFEVAFDALSRSGKAGDREALREAIKATTKKTIVGDISWAKGPVGNVAKTPLVGGQWGKGKQFAYDLTIVNNKRAPFIPTSGTLRGMV